MGRYLSILEVSQKQAYIFSSNKLRDNLARSAVIAEITSSEYFSRVIQDPGIYNRKDNLVYAGGGHTVLVFSDLEKAREFNKIVTRTILENFEGIEIFASVMEYRENDENGRRIGPSENLSQLKEQLERKKAVRRASFRQGTFGLAPLDSDTRDRVSDYGAIAIPDSEKTLEKKLMPKKFETTYKLEELGGSKGDNNFIAVVHLDGNGMGNRINDYYESLKGEDWEEFRRHVREYSDTIDRDYKEAFRQMAQVVAERIESGKLKDLDLEEGHFPVRRIISSGDDMCFVSEGRIGIECSAVLIEKLNAMTNCLDHRPYSACAGVAIVHQKYPFYRAYELAEELCSSAKKFGANLDRQLNKELSDNGASISSIDWHIEMGEIRDTLEETREDYNTLDGRHLEMRPYIVSGPEEILKLEPYRQYSRYFHMMNSFLYTNKNEQYGQLKNLRGVLKQGQEAASYYMDFHKIKEITRDGIQADLSSKEIRAIGTGKATDYEIFHTTADGKSRALMFDAAESIGFFIKLREERAGS